MNDYKKDSTRSENTSSRFKKKSKQEKTLVSVNHNTLSNLEKQRREANKLCDVSLLVEDKEFPAHKLVLAASSKYFMKVLIIEGKEDKKIPIKGITASVMSEILTSIYTQKINFSNENIGDLLHGASLLQFPGVVEAASSYVKQTANLENIFWFRELVRVHPFKSLKDAVLGFFLIHIEKVASLPEFLSFTFDELDQIFASDDLRIESEKNVFEMIVKWVKQDTDTRKEHFSLLFKRVRLQFVAVDYIVDIIRNVMLAIQIENYPSLLEDALIYHIRPSARNAQKCRKCFAAE